MLFKKFWVEEAQFEGYLNLYCTVCMHMCNTDSIISQNKGFFTTYH